MNSLLKKVRKFNRQHYTLRVVLELLAIVMIWWSIWGLLDTYLLHRFPWVSYAAGGIIGLIILYAEDFKLSQLD